MMKLRKIVAASALGLTMGLTLLGSGVASAHSGPYANSAVIIKNAHHVKVSVNQQVKNYESGYGYGNNGYGYGNFGCGCGCDNGCSGYRSHGWWGGWWGW